MSPRTRSLLFLALVPLATILGCDEITAPTPPPGSSFYATVAGDLARAFSGEAVFTTDAPGPEYGFAMAMVDSTDGGSGTVVRHAVYLFGESGGIPPQGEYPVGGQDALRVWLILDGDEPDPIYCVAESGSVHIIAATSAVIRGSLDVQAGCFVEGDALAGDTVLARGSFRAVGGSVEVPDEVEERPGLRGRFELEMAGGSPVPASVFDGIVLIGDDEFVRLEIAATGGYMEFDGSGAYEHRVSQEVRVDGQPAPSMDWVDRGSCVASATNLTCLSGLVMNRGFTATILDGGIEVSQDLNGEGLAVTYLYVPSE